MRLDPDERLRDDHFFLRAQRWIQQLDVDSITLTCRQELVAPLGNKRRPSIETTRCLQNLQPYRILDLQLAGIRDVIMSPTACCAEEDLAPLAQRWTGVLGDIMSVSVRPAKPARNWAWAMSPGHVPIDRRALLGLSRRSDPPWPIHDATADDDMRYLTSLRATGTSSVEESPPGVLLAADGCTACGVCVAACPHNALALEVDGCGTSLRHAPDLCRGEQQCVALCPQDALSFQGPTTWPDVLLGQSLLLATLETTMCERCRVRFPADSGSQLCETCRIRRSDPFGSHLPAAALEILRARGHTPRT